jgi:hypothetical protein
MISVSELLLQFLMTHVYSNNLCYYTAITSTVTCGYNAHQTYLPDGALPTACAMGKLIMETVII